MVDVLENIVRGSCASEIDANSMAISPVPLFNRWHTAASMLSKILTGWMVLWLVDVAA